MHAITDTAEYYETVSDALLPVMLDKDPKHVRNIAINKAQQFLRLAAAAHRLELEGVGGSVPEKKEEEVA